MKRQNYSGSFKYYVISNLTFFLLKLGEDLVRFQLGFDPIYILNKINE